MLTDIEDNGTTDGDGKPLDQCVSWAPHGRCFIVKDKDAFVAKVIPK